jgi:hypothetical protein
MLLIKGRRESSLPTLPTPPHVYGRRVPYGRQACIGSPDVGCGALVVGAVTLVLSTCGGGGGEKKKRGEKRG